MPFDFSAPIENDTILVARWSFNETDSDNDGADDGMEISCESDPTAAESIYYDSDAYVSESELNPVYAYVEADVPGSAFGYSSCKSGDTCREFFYFAEYSRLSG